MNDKKHKAVSNSTLKMNIALPNDVYAILRSGEQNEKALELFKMTAEEAVASLKKSNMYLKASPEDFASGMYFFNISRKKQL